MNRFDVFCNYIAINNHFKSASYDYFKYQGKTRVKAESFEKRRDKYFFEKIALKIPDKEIVGFLVANTVKNGKEYWINDYNKAEETYRRWQGKIESLAYSFEQECKKIWDQLVCDSNAFEDLFKVKETHPVLFKMLIKDELSLETLVVINKMVNFKPEWDVKLHDPLWNEYSHIMEKYSPFLVIDDKNKYRNIMLEAFLNEESK